MRNVLGLYGPAGSGKDSIGDYLISEHGWHGKVSFAYNLKKMCEVVFQLTEYDLFTQEGKMKYFDNPIEFNPTLLGAVMIWMAKTHSTYPVTFEDRDKVKSLFGTRLNNPRDVLQFVGTEVCRQLIPSYHVDVLKSIVLSRPDDNLIVTDVRFPDEAAAVQELGGVVVKVHREDTSTAQNVNRKHSSETSLVNWDGFHDVIDNNHDGINNLHHEIDLFLERNGLCQNAVEKKTSL